MPKNEKNKPRISRCDPSPDDLDEPERAEEALLNQAAKERAQTVEQAANKPLPEQSAA